MPAKVLKMNYKISLDGADLSNQVMNDILEVEVDSAVFLPTACTLILNNNQPDKYSFAYSDADTFDLGKKLKITVDTHDMYEGAQAEKAVVFDGEITAVEAEYNANGASLLRVRGYDRAYRLAQGKKTATYLKRSDSDIISKLASGAGLTAQVNSTSVVYDYVIQANQSEWDFTVSRARRNGLLVQCQGTKLILAKPSTGGAAPILEWKKDLLRFEPRLSVLGQYSESSDLGWDSTKKANVTGKGTAPSSTHQAIGYGKNGAAAVKGLLGKTEQVLTEHPVASVDEAKALAEAAMVEAEGRWVRAEGVCYGNPSLLAGMAVDIKGVGTKFSGKYFLSQVRHEITADGYRTWFSINGSSPATLLGLLEQGDEMSNPRIDGVVTAVVTNIKDETKAGKVKVKFPWLPKASGAEIESAWARMTTPNTGKDRGLAFFPEVDDEVLVAFEHGDVNYPVIVGALWNGKDTPPKEADLSSGKNNTRVIKSRSGHLIILDDTQGSEKITVKDKSGNNSIVIDTASKTITFSADADLVLAAKGKIKLSGDQGITLDSKQDVGVTSMTKVALTAASSNSVELATAGASVKGIKVDIQGNTTASVKGSAMVEIQGGIVKIN
jgi:uncharacterized protein involved in type VI secretion and phage assembly